MESSVNWKRKIAAYLWRTPAFSLWPEADRQLAENLRQIVCANLTDEDRVAAAKSEQIASGLDIPPFLDRLDADCFLKQPVLTHPLSGQEYLLQLPEGLNEENITAHLKTTLTNLAAQTSEQNDDEKDRALFLLLWRNFSQTLAAEDAKGLGDLWQNLPADPRIPSHTIWEHAAVSSAVAGAWPKPALLIFTLASAQDMVATARRTQDAWMGSFLWSYLSWQAIKVIAEHCGPDAVISPALKGQPLVDLWLAGEMNVKGIPNPDRALLETGSIPNMFTAIVPKDQAAPLAVACENAIQDAWERISGKVKDAVRQAYCNTKTDSPVSWEAWERIWTRQQNAFLHNQGIYWVVCPWGDDHQAVINAAKNHIESPVERMLKKCQDNRCDPHIGMVYSLLASFAGTELTARKNLRDFRQSVEEGYKCSLCGKWEAVHPGLETGKTTYGELRNFWATLKDLNRTNETMKLVGRIRKGEMLCGICLTRRLALETCFKEELGLDHHLFPSTAGIATAAWRGRLLEACAENNDLAQALKDYEKSLQAFLEKHRFAYPATTTAFLIEKAKQSGLNKCGSDFLKIDGDWLATEAFDESLIREDSAIAAEELQNCKTKLETLLDCARRKALGRPPGYLAILALDGDHMGDWVTGAKGKGPDYGWLIHKALRDKPEVLHLPSRPSGPAMQLALSDSLKNFALEFARDVVEKEHAGKLVYAGGDDLLAFLPLEHLFPAMMSLYGSFRGGEDGFITKDNRLLRLSGGVRKKDAGQRNFEGVTPSMGVAIVHHSYPLDHAMAEAQKVLKNTAKKQLGRNAFAIRLLRRSGEPTEAGCRFNKTVDSCSGDVLDLLSRLTDSIRKDTLSGRLPYTMGRHLWASADPPEKDRDMEEAKRAELVRIAARHVKKKEHSANDIVKDVLSLFDTLKNQQHLNPWDMTARILLILRFMAGKE